MKIVLTVLSPLHVGARVLKPVDFICKGRDVHVVDFEELGRFLEQRALLSDLMHWVETQGDSQATISSYLERKGLLKDELIRTVSVKRLELPPGTGRPPREILEQVFDPVSRVPVIPGSSVKGAIRNALVTSSLGKRGDADHLVADALVEKRVGGRRSKEKPGELLPDPMKGSLVGRKVSGPNSDWLRCLKITDAFPVAGKYRFGLVQARVFSLSRISGPTTLLSRAKDHPIYVECILPGSEFELNITWDSDAASVLFSDRPPVGSLGDLIEACTEHAQRVCREEMTFVRSYGPRELESHFDTMMEKANLRLGWGSGWLSTTIGSILSNECRITVRRRFYKPREGFPFPKYRRYQVEAYADRVRPVSSFGWVRIAATKNEAREL